MNKNLVALLGAGLLVASVSACASGGGAPQTGSRTEAPQSVGACTNKIVHQSAPQVAVWAWYPKFAAVVDMFNNAHKDVQICWNNVGAGAPEYTKFTTAIAAGTGAPDVIMLENETLPGFGLQKALVDQSKYGANNIKSHFTAGAWKDASSGAAVYSIPVAAGPVGMLYRKDIFDKYGLTVPTTWAEYASVAEKLHKAAPDIQMTDFPSNGSNTAQALFNQKGAVPFDYSSSNPTSLGVMVNSAATKDVLNYWNGLIQKKLVGARDTGTPDWTTAMIGGKYATYLAAAWAPGYLQGAGAGTANKGAEWRVAPLPQWSANEPVSVNIGGAGFSVTAQSKQPQRASTVAQGIYAAEDALKYSVTDESLFPVNVAVQNASWFRDREVPFFGGQTSNKDIFIPASAAYKGVVNGPFTSYYYAQMTVQFVKMIAGQETANQAADNLQSAITSYAKTQGFKLK